MSAGPVPSAARRVVRCAFPHYFYTPSGDVPADLFVFDVAAAGEWRVFRERRHSGDLGRRWDYGYEDVYERPGRGGAIEQLRIVRDRFRVIGGSGFPSNERTVKRYGAAPGQPGPPCRRPPWTTYIDRAGEKKVWHLEDFHQYFPGYECKEAGRPPTCFMPEPYANGDESDYARMIRLWAAHRLAPPRRQRQIDDATLAIARRGDDYPPPRAAPIVWTPETAARFPAPARRRAAAALVALGPRAAARACGYAL